MIPRIFIMRGGVIGIDGPLTSPGMDALGREITARTGLTPRLFNWNEWEGVADRIALIPAIDQIILIGYSGGGSRATFVCNRLAPKRIDLLILYDPSPWWQMEPVTTNVSKAICFHNQNPALLTFGGGHLKGPNVVEIQISEQHLFVQSDERLHDVTIKSILETVRRK